ncbi:MAG TPA: 5-formyltetrahydrofolate cyclo-ligase [Geminicoccaceae bacterium]|nr:5-formyltetrahydrofolate cyclo-ligase [Geminicoccaceae bacterium]
MPRSWDEIRTWRRGRRAALAEARLALPAPRRRELNAAIADTLGRLLLRPPPASLGFYWPFRGEVDLRPLVRSLRDEAGTRAALPVVVRERAPVEFWEWDPGARLARGVWGIPIPTERVVLTPGVLLVPLLGFDGRGYRLGYGGGYYDRTLAALQPRPLAIGVGYEVSRIETIHPQPHDARMDAIVTERGAFAVTDAGLIPFEGGRAHDPKAT